MNLCRSLSCALLALGAMGSFRPAAAADPGIIYHYNSYFGASATNPGAYAPWVSATFLNVSTGTVLLTLSNSAAMPLAHKVDELEFNLNPAFNPTSLTFTLVTSSGGFDLPGISKEIDGFKADGDGKYDVKFAFNTGAGDGHTFTAGEFVTYQITGISSLTAADFGHLSAPSGGVGPFYAAGHLLGLGEFANMSAWIAPSQITIVPEPSASALLILFASGWLARRRFLKRSS